MKNKKLLLVLLLLLGIGFALVSATLLITGNVKIATNNADFDVKFTKAVLDETDISETAISPDGKTITFITNDLTTVGDISKLDFEVTNNSEMYDAVVSIDCTVEGAKNSYYEITKEVASPIVGKTIGTGNVQIKLLKASLEDFSEEFTCTLTATAQERTTYAILKYVPKYFAYGEPTTSSSQDYTTLGKNVFVGLDESGQKSICTLATGSLECFKNNNVAEEIKHIKEVFKEESCSGDSDVLCNLGSFGCRVSSDGSVGCGSGLGSCYLNPDGFNACNQQ